MQKPKPQPRQSGESARSARKDPSPAASGRERRRSERIPYYNPLVITWIRDDGVRIHEYAGAADVSAHGCLLKMTTPVPVKANIIIRHPRHKTSVRGTVVRILEPGEDGLLRIAVDLETPGMVFWLLEALDDDGAPPTPLPSELL